MLAMQSLPSGTVTFVFTDIEGSTELLKQLGSGYGRVLATHRRIVRETFQAANGIEIDTGRRRPRRAVLRSRRADPRAGRSCAESEGDLAQRALTSRCLRAADDLYHVRQADVLHAAG